MTSKIYNVVVGTAGHIDHGKTSLVRALTGLDADRLKEEKERGLTIDLGFAPLILPEGTKVGIIDVPGHERFIKNMVAGATGIDIVVLVVAADDGIMPQTREHLDIMTLLGLKKGLVALTKIDVVEEDLVEITREEIVELSEGTFLENPAIFPLSSITGEGVEPLKQALFDLIRSCPSRKTEGVFRMPIQRVFAAKGHGTIVTGVPMSGQVALGEKLEILPQGFVGRVRKIQAYKEEIDLARAGHSTAINISDTDYKEVTRGNVVGAPGFFQPSKQIEATLQYLGHLKRPLKNYSEVKLHVGTAEIMGKVIILDKKKISPGEEGYIQILLEEPVVIGYGDPYILRLPSPALTLGGGKLLGNSKKRWKSGRAEVVELMVQKERLIFSTEGRILSLFVEDGPFLIRREELQQRSQLSSEEFERAMTLLLEKGDLLNLSRAHLFLSKKELEKVQVGILSAVETFHKESPLSLGISPSELEKKLSPISSEVVEEALRVLHEKGKIKIQSGGLISLPSFGIDLNPTQEKIFQKMEKIFGEQPFSPPKREELAGMIKENSKEVEELFSLLVQQKVLVKIQSLFFHRDSLEKAKGLIRDHLEKEGKLQTSQAREILGTSRKFSIPLLEYLDEVGLTRREGDYRVLK